MTQNKCQIYEKNGLICLRFHDSCSNWPSKSNDAAISFRGRKPFIRHTKDFHVRMAEIKAQYKLACQASGIFPRFGSELVHATCFLGSKARMFDSHNFCKTFGDFCEEVNIVDNDRTMTIWPMHKKHCGIIEWRTDTLDIFLRIVNDDIIEDFYRSFTHE